MAAFLDSLPPDQAGFLRAAGFAAKAGSVMLLPGPGGVAGAVLGLDDAALDSPWTYGGLPLALPEASVWRLASGADPMAATLGWLLGAYRFDRYRSRKSATPALLAIPPGTEAAVAQAHAICMARNLINTPAEDGGPAALADAVATVAARHGAQFDLIEGDAVATGFPALHAVGRAAAPGRQPRVAMLRWSHPGGDPADPLVVLCGKGVCFDTGGLDLKPAEGMRRMKKDMGGAAMMLALADVLMAAKTRLRLLLLVGAVENSVGPDAFRPGDVLRTRLGLTVEVGNTDAEGRLVLADLLAYGAEQRPALLLDAATLTGAARVALGPDLPALFTDDAPLLQCLLDSAKRVHDPVWQLPLHSSYDSWLDSSVADMNNVASKPMAGAVIAALFLRRFVPEGVPWAHIDTYAWNDTSRAGRPEGGECPGLRTLLDGVTAWLSTGRDRSGANSASVTHQSRDK
ncbi:leucyl aminopeptidase family protein [Humitalea sp. 24SJ18S-53]|uniref:leucyl aminopeptidase family protein n=1 Tax=Humitalea sp. 24SJ18S-53 TaxID=3422307 RepID=UPI003D664D70